MYCIKCGVKLGDTEKKCPLCGTVVYHPELERPAVQPLYPQEKMPKAGSEKKALSSVLALLFLISLVVSFMADLQIDGHLDWFGYVAGGLVLSYVTFFLPLWFQKPNPMIFISCDFAVIAAYLWYIDLVTGGGWFWTFGLPVSLGLGAVICAMVALLYYVGRGKLYICGGGIMALGVWILGVELLLDGAFGIAFSGWSVYPMGVLCLLGGFLIYLAIDSSAREALHRKLFF